MPILTVFGAARVFVIATRDIKILNQRKRNLFPLRDLSFEAQFFGGIVCNNQTEICQLHKLYCEIYVGSYLFQQL